MHKGSWCTGTQRIVVHKGPWHTRGPWHMKNSWHRVRIEKIKFYGTRNGDNGYSFDISLL